MGCGMSDNPLTDPITAFWSRTCDTGLCLAHWPGHQPAFDEISRDIGRRFRAQWPAMAEHCGAAWLDWGCGGGAGMRALRGLGAKVYGADIAWADEDGTAYRPGERLTPTWFTPLLIDVDNPNQVVRGIGTQVDGFLSTACFQHFRSKAYTERIVRLIPRLVKPGGRVMIQIRRDTPNSYDEYSEHSVRSYAERAIYATVWAVDEFSDVLDRHGIEVERIEALDDANQYTYYFGHVRGDVAKI